MGKETKIGLAVVGSLLLLFGYVLYSRISKETAAAVAKNGDKAKPAAEKSSKPALASGPSKSAGAGKSKTLSSGPSKNNMLTAEVVPSKPPAMYGSESADPYNRKTSPTTPSAASSTDNTYSRPTFRYGDDSPSSTAGNTAANSATHDGGYGNSTTASDVPSFRSAKNAVTGAASDLYGSAREAASSLAHDAAHVDRDHGNAATAPANDPFANVKSGATEAAGAVVKDAKETIERTVDELKHSAEPPPGRLDRLVDSAANELDAKTQESLQNLGADKEKIAEAANDALNKLSPGENPLRPMPSSRDQVNASSAPEATAASPSKAHDSSHYNNYDRPAAAEPTSNSLASPPISTRSAPPDPFHGASASDVRSYSAPPLGAASSAATNPPDRYSPPEYSPTQSRFDAADRYRPAEPAAATASEPPSAFRSRSSSPPPPPAMPTAPRRTAQPTGDASFMSRPLPEMRTSDASRFNDADRGSGVPPRASSPSRSSPPTAIPAANSGSSLGSGFGGSRLSTSPRRHVGERYVVEPNDNFWLISERVYGNGAFFKALQEHNRGRFPLAENLQAGDELSTPSVETLRQTYPHLCPKPERLEQAQRATNNFTSQRQTGRTYVVEAGDTLFDIARYELGKAAHWSEIYELNKDLLGQDFNHLTPGMKLALPSDVERDSMTRRPGALPR